MTCDFIHPFYNSNFSPFVISNLYPSSKFFCTMALPAVIGIKNSLFLGRKSLFPILATLIQYSLYHFNIGIKNFLIFGRKSLYNISMQSLHSFLHLVLSIEFGPLFYIFSSTCILPPYINIQLFILNLPSLSDKSSS